MNLQFVLVFYYLTLVRKSLVSVHALIYLHSNIYCRNFPNFEVSCGSYLYKGTLTFILLPLLNYDLSCETSSANHHFLSLFTQNVQIRVTLSLLNCDLSTLGSRSWSRHQKLCEVLQPVSPQLIFTVLDV